MSAFSGSYLLISRNRVEIARLGGAALRPKERHTPNTCPRSTHLFILKVFFLSTARVRGGEVGRLCSSGFRARSVNFFPGGSPAVAPLFDLFLTFSHFFLTGPHTCCLTLPSALRCAGRCSGAFGARIPRREWDF